MNCSGKLLVDSERETMGDINLKIQQDSDRSGLLEWETGSLHSRRRCKTYWSWLQGREGGWKAIEQSCEAV
jgi:hypothetical protein